MKRIRAKKYWDRSNEAEFLCIIERADGSKQALYRKDNPFYGIAMIKRGGESK